MTPTRRLTQADEKKLIDFEIYRTRLKLFKLNKSLRYYRITGIDITHSEQMMAPITTHWNLFGRLANYLKRKQNVQK